MSPQFLCRGGGVGKERPSEPPPISHQKPKKNGNNKNLRHIKVDENWADSSPVATAQVPTLDGRVLRLPCPEVVSPGYERRLAGEGMPISKTSGPRGDLLIRFKLVFPAFLPQASKVEALRRRIGMSRARISA